MINEISLENDCKKYKQYIQQNALLMFILMHATKDEHNLCK